MDSPSELRIPNFYSLLAHLSRLTNEIHTRFDAKTNIAEQLRGAKDFFDRKQDTTQYHLAISSLTNSAFVVA